MAAKRRSIKWSRGECAANPMGVRAAPRADGTPPRARRPGLPSVHLRIVGGQTHMARATSVARLDRLKRLVPRGCPGVVRGPESEWNDATRGTEP